MRPGFVLPGVHSSPPSQQPGWPRDHKLPLESAESKVLPTGRCQGACDLIFSPHAELLSLYSDPLFYHPQARTTCSNLAPTLSPKPQSSWAGGRLRFLPRGLGAPSPPPGPVSAWPATVRGGQLPQGHKGLNPGEGTRSDLPPKRIFQFIPQHNTAGRSQPPPPPHPSEGPPRATPGSASG